MVQGIGNAKGTKRQKKEEYISVKLRMIFKA